MTPRIARIVQVLFVVQLFAAAARAEDAFYRVAVTQLKLTEGELPLPGAQAGIWQNWTQARSMHPFAVLDGEGEAFVSNLAPDQQFAIENETGAELARTLLVRAPQSRDINGRIFLPLPDGSGMRRARFSITASAANPGARDAFFEAQLAYYESLLARDIPGGAWFRFRAQQARDALGKRNQDPRRRNRLTGTQSLDDTYALFTGGRAVSENLQLDRVLDPIKYEPETVAIDSIQGITTTEIDWKPLIKGLEPKLDPLAECVPEDQHAIFFATIDAARRVLGALDRTGAPVLDLLEVRHEDSKLLARYQRQLGVSLDDLTANDNPALISSIAVTGSDPYFRTGTDVAVLFESRDPHALQAELLATIKQNTPRTAPITVSTDRIDGIAASVTRSEDRSVSSYVALVGDAVVLTNSPAQLERMSSARRESRVLSKLPEYRFFRNRYPLGADDETAFVILSDATIRRWCGPTWRIADSRRTRAAAVMADRAMRVLAGARPATQHQMQIEKFGNPDFLTPIAELQFTQVTDSEKSAYIRWRDGYQSNWRWAFDPIAAKLTVRDTQLSLDLSVIPLIVETDYRELVELTRDVSIDPALLDARPSLMNFAIALNTKSQPMRSWGAFARNLVAGLDVDPFAWMGPTLSVHWYDDSRWRAHWDAGLVRHTPEPTYILPLVLKMQTVSQLRLVAFLTATRAFIEQTAPGMTRWETREHAGQPYVRVTEADNRRSVGLPFSEVFYASTPQALVIAIDEKVLHQFITSNTTTQPSPATRPSRLWLGSSVCLQLDSRFFDEVLKPFGIDFNRSIQEQRRLACWNNLIILNELRRHFPSKNPGVLYEEHWHATLTCPAGGEYVWSDQWQTMESTVFGSPSNPKPGPTAPPLAEMFEFLNMGITFENQGLRARAVLDNAPRK